MNIVNVVNVCPGPAIAGGAGGRAYQLDGYAESRVYIFGPEHAGYVVALRLTTDRSKSVISEWGFEAPWPGHEICWDYDPEDVIPKRHQGEYKHLLDSRLMRVLDDRRALRSGYPVEGLLCGYSYQPIPESTEPVVPATLTFAGATGGVGTIGLRLRIVRTPRCIYPSKYYKETPLVKVGP